MSCSNMKCCSKVRSHHEAFGTWNDNFVKSLKVNRFYLVCLFFHINNFGIVLDIGYIKRLDGKLIS